MNTKIRYEKNKQELIEIINNNSLTASQKLDKLNFLEVLSNLEIYQTELSAQNKELIEKEHQLIEARDELQELFNFAPVAYLQLDEKFKILKYNTFAYELLNQNNSSLNKIKQLNFYIHKDGMMEYLDFITKTKELKKHDGVLQFINDDKILYGRVNINSYKRDNKVYYLLSIIDITKEIEQEAIILNQAKQAAMGEMLSMITHQWKQPLSILSSLSSSLQLYIDLKKYDEESFRDYTQDILDQVEYMSETIDDFKDFFNQERAQSKIYIKECIDRAVKFTAPALKKHMIELSIVYKNDNNYAILAYRHDVCQILMNIINNAKDQLIKKDIERKIELTVSTENDLVVLSIKNNGGMIDDQIMNDIFKQHFTTKANKKGSGLGLYISKMIVEEHLGGSLNVENIPSEDSVVFLLKIPLLVD